MLSALVTHGKPAGEERRIALLRQWTGDLGPTVPSRTPPQQFSFCCKRRFCTASEIEEFVSWHGVSPLVDVFGGQVRAVSNGFKRLTLQYALLVCAYFFR